jgi:hypothetical protein
MIVRRGLEDGDGEALREAGGADVAAVVGAGLGEPDAAVGAPDPPGDAAAAVPMSARSTA